MQQTTIAMDIAQMRPSDIINVSFPLGFEVEYMRRKDNSIEKKELVRMNVYYWDEPDHRTKDFYLYDKEDERFAKIGDLTPESRDKVWDFIKSA